MRQVVASLRPDRTWARISAAGAVAVAVSFLWTSLPVRWPFSMCPLRAVTGIPCPLCGLTTSFVALSHGRFHQAFAANPLGPLLYAGSLMGLIVWIAWGRRRSSQLIISGRWVTTLALVATGASWIFQLHRFAWI
ncbi:MAG: DUF2752 domain-containing protein [Actinomycetota bacterium]